MISEQFSHVTQLADPAVDQNKETSPTSCYSRGTERDTLAPGDANSRASSMSIGNFSHLATATQFRRSDLHGQLIAAERELALLREESSTKDAEVAILKSALQREHDAYLRLQQKHGRDVDHLRNEYDKHVSHLTEQLDVLRGLTDAADVESHRAADEAAVRKSQFLALLEKEREEKSRILGEYRQQTECLISEQSREIQGLRGLVEAARAEEERLLMALARSDELRIMAEQNASRLQIQLSEVQTAALHTAHVFESKLSLEVETMSRQTAVLREDINAASERNAALSAQVADLGQREAAWERDRGALAQTHAAALSELRQQMQISQEAAEKRERELNEEHRIASAQYTQVIQSLRADLERAESKCGDAAAAVAQLEDAAAAHDTAMKVACDRISAAEQAAEGSQRLILSLESEVRDLRSSLAASNKELSAAIADRAAADKAAEAATEDLRRTLAARDSELQTARQALQVADARTASRDGELAGLRNELQAAAEATARMRDEDTRQRADFERVRLELVQSSDEAAAAARTATRECQEERIARSTAVSEVQRLQVLVTELRASAEAAQRRLADGQRLHAGCAAALAERDQRIGELQSETTELQQIVAALRLEVTSVRTTCETQLTDARNSWSSRLQSLQAKVDGAQRLEEQLHALTASHASQRTCDAEEVARLKRLLDQRQEEAQAALAACRAEANEELDRLDGLLQDLRGEHHQLQALKASIQRESAEALADAERRVAIAQEALDAERASRAKLSEDLRARDNMIADLNGTTRVLSNRMSLKDEELRRSAQEVDEVSARLLEAHAQIGVRDTTIGQLSARVRVLEAKGGVGAHG